MGWRVDIPSGSLQLAEVDHLVLAVDRSYPNSQPRIYAPAAGDFYIWPHVEQGGLLCLRPSRCLAPTADRIATHLTDAIELLNFSEAKRCDEFEREFATYWALRTSPGPACARVLTLVNPGGKTRKLFYFFDSRAIQFVVGETKEALKKWLLNTGANPADKEIFSTWLFRMSPPWAPKDFPEKGGDITRMMTPEMTKICLTPGVRAPFLFEVETKTGAAFAAVVLRGSEYKELVKGFRNITRVPAELITSSFAKHPVERCKVSRVDGAWIHGRDHDSSFAELKNRKVAIIGCGAIGSTLAKLLAQAGVGELVFVDGDELNSANISRHLLGMEFVGLNKAKAMRNLLRAQFPHLTFDHFFQKRFERMTRIEREEIAGADLIIAAGIDFDGEAALDAWRRTLDRPPAYLSSWVEAFAVAGHAVLLYGEKSILEGFDDQERPRFRLSDWPEKAGALIVEAGCGNSFQPHGVVDLSPSIGLAAGLAVDALMDRVPSSCRRVWMGDSSSVEKRGGVVTTSFTDSFKIREYTWA